MKIPALPDIPILVETPSRPFFRMTRCHYMSIENSVPRPGWEIRLGSDVLPFLMLGLVGIIQQPFGEPRFVAPELIDRLFEQLEEKAGLLINFDDIWLPSFLFERETHTGDTYRIGIRLFLGAYLFREGRLGEGEFEVYCKKFGETLVFSEEETRAFAAWSEEQIARAQNQEPKNWNLSIRKRNEPQ